MGRKSISPSVLKDILRLRDNGLSFRAIGERCQLSHSAVRRYYQQAQKRNLSWDKVKYHSDAKLTGEIKQLQQPPKVKYHEPNFDEYSKLLYLHKIRGIDDAYAYYCEEDEPGKKYSRSSFFRRFQHWRQAAGEGKNTFLSHNWAAGECCQIDYCGDTLTLTVPLNDNRFDYRPVQIFVGVLPYSKYLFCYATKDQTRGSWFEAIIAMLRFFGGVPSRVMFDNSTSMVKEASRHVPILSSDTEALAAHYRFSAEAVAPAEPTFKGAAENAVKVIQQKILYTLRDVKFTSIREINSILQRELNRINSAKMRAFNGMSREELFNIEKEHLKALPGLDYQYNKPLIRYKAGRNYCIRIRGHSYSVPYRYAGYHVLARVESDNMLRIYDADSLVLIAEHYYWGEQKNAPGFTHILDEHRAPHHYSEKQRLASAQRLVDEMPQFVRLFASKLLVKIAKSSDGKKANLLFGFNSLKRQYGAERLNAACARALEVGSDDFQWLKRLLSQHKETAPAQQITDQTVLDFMYDSGYLRDKKEFEQLAAEALKRSQNHEN